MSNWPNDHVDRLKVLHARGMSMAQIAAALSREFRDARYTREAVSGKVHRLKLPQRPRDAQLAHLRTASAQRAREMAARPPKQPMPKGVMVLTPVKGGDVATAARVENMAARESPAENVVLMARQFSPLPGCAPVPFGSPGCRWPVGGEGADMLCCGAARRDASSYCATHDKVSQPPVSAKRKLDERLNIPRRRAA